MTIWESFKSLWQEDSGWEDAASEEPFPAGNPRDIREEKESAKSEPLGGHPHPEPQISAIEIFSPVNYEDCQHIADALKAGKVAIVNYYYTLESIATRVRFFMDGFVYAAEGYQEGMTRHICIYTPSTAAIQREEALKGNKLSFPWSGQ